MKRIRKMISDTVQYVHPRASNIVSEVSRRKSFQTEHLIDRSHMLRRPESVADQVSRRISVLVHPISVELVLLRSGSWTQGR